MLYVIVCIVPFVIFGACIVWVVWELSHAPLVEDDPEPTPGAYWHAGDR